MFELNKLDPGSAAVLALDCQNGIFSMVQGSSRILQPAGKVLEAARTKRIAVFHVGLGFRPGYPEIHPAHPTFAALKQSGRFILGSDSAASPEPVSPNEGDIVVHKHRVSAFSGNDLEMLLRAKGITQLVLFGVATSGIVLSTLRQAADMDFHCMVVEDCCFDADEEVHRVLTNKVFPRQAKVVRSGEFVSGL